MNNDTTKFAQAFHRSIQLRLTEFGTAIAVAPRIMEHADHAARVLVASLKAKLVVEEQQPLKLDVPADWWQHVKQRWFPAWALARWPVRTAVIALPVRTIYPALQTKIPRQFIGPVLTVLVRNEPVASFYTESGRVVDGRSERQVERDLASPGEKVCPVCGKELHPRPWK